MKVLSQHVMLPVFIVLLVVVSSFSSSPSSAAASSAGESMTTPGRYEPPPSSDAAGELLYKPLDLAKLAPPRLRPTEAQAPRARPTTTRTHRLSDLVHALKQTGLPDAVVALAHAGVELVHLRAERGSLRRLRESGSGAATSLGSFNLSTSILNGVSKSTSLKLPAGGLVGHRRGRPRPPS